MTDPNTPQADVQASPRIITIHIGRSTWQGYENEAPRRTLVDKLPFFLYDDDLPIECGELSGGNDMQTLPRPAQTSR